MLAITINGNVNEKLANVTGPENGDFLPILILMMSLDAVRCPKYFE